MKERITSMELNISKLDNLLDQHFYDVKYIFMNLETLNEIEKHCRVDSKPDHIVPQTFCVGMYMDKKIYVDNDLEYGEVDLR